MKGIGTITREQSRAGRALVGMTVDTLAAAAGLGLSTISAFEHSRRGVSPRTVNAIRTALERAGVDFIDENDGGAGVRLRRFRRQTGGQVEPVYEITGAGRIVAGERTVSDCLRYRIEGTLDAKLSTLAELAEAGEVAIDLGSFGWFSLRVIDVDRGTVRFTGPIAIKHTARTDRRMKPSVLSGEFRPYARAGCAECRRIRAWDSGGSDHRIWSSTSENAATPCRRCGSLS